MRGGGRKRGNRREGTCLVSPGNLEREDAGGDGELAQRRVAIFLSDGRSARRHAAEVDSYALVSTTTFEAKESKLTSFLDRSPSPSSPTDCSMLFRESRLAFSSLPSFAFSPAELVDSRSSLLSVLTASSDQPSSLLDTSFRTS